MDNEDKQPFLEHLEELRKRLISSFIAVGVGFAIAYFFKELLFDVLVLPIQPALSKDGHLIFTSPTEMFITQIKVALIGGVLISLPYIFYQIWMFVAPGLYQKEKKVVTPLILSSTLLFVAGAAFAYAAVLPIAFKFLLGFGREGADGGVSIEALISVREGFAFSIKMLFAFGVAFQLPIVIFFLSKMGVVTPEFLRKKRAYAILLAFVAGAILTPPDIFSQCLLALPLMLLYEASILVARLVGKPKADEPDTDEAADDAAEDD